MKKMESLIKNSSVGLEGIEELKRIAEILLNNGYPDTYFKIDPSVVRGLGYYTGSVFETEFVEKNSSLGGRARQFIKDDFVFDIGPSFYWMPDIFENYTHYLYCHS